MTTINSTSGYKANDRAQLKQLLRELDESQYGEIDVSSVTDMSNLFVQSSFNQSIAEWNVSSVTDMSGMFYKSYFNQPIAEWNVSSVTDMSAMFYKSSFNQPIAGWNVSSVTGMSYMFFGSSFNQSIAEWNVSSVTDMSYMFFESPFNKPIAEWNVSSVTDMTWMFYNSFFNQPIGGWNVSSVTDMSFMLGGSPFNQPIGEWNVSSVFDMKNMFYVSLFNQPIGSWNVTSVTNMSNMFIESPFNQPIGSWNVTSLANMSYMFLESPFNQPIGSWNVTSVTTMSCMFAYAMTFIQPIGSWNVSSVTDMSFMFHSSPFNQPIGGWNVSSVLSMEDMFILSLFNQPIGAWNVSSVKNADSMFWNASFNQPICGWNVSSVTNMDSMFSTCKFNQPIGEWNVSSVKIMGEIFIDGDFDRDITQWRLRSLKKHPTAACFGKLNPKHYPSQLSLTDKYYLKCRLQYTNYIPNNILLCHIPLLVLYIGIGWLHPNDRYILMRIFWMSIFNNSLSMFTNSFFGRDLLFVRFNTIDTFSMIIDLLDINVLVEYVSSYLLALVKIETNIVISILTIMASTLTQYGIGKRLGPTTLTLYYASYWTLSITKVLIRGNSDFLKAFVDIKPQYIGMLFAPGLFSLVVFQDNKTVIAFFTVLNVYYWGFIYFFRNAVLGIIGAIAQSTQSFVQNAFRILFGKGIQAITNIKNKYPVQFKVTDLCWNIVMVVIVAIGNAHHGWNVLRFLTLWTFSTSLLWRVMTLFESRFTTLLPLVSQYRVDMFSLLVCTNFMVFMLAGVINTLTGGNNYQFNDMVEAFRKKEYFVSFRYFGEMVFPHSISNIYFIIAFYVSYTKDRKLSFQKALRITMPVRMYFMSYIVADRYNFKRCQNRYVGFFDFWPTVYHNPSATVDENPNQLLGLLRFMKDFRVKFPKGLDRMLFSNLIKTIELNKSYNNDYDYYDYDYDYRKKLSHQDKISSSKKGGISYRSYRDLKENVEPIITLLDRNGNKIDISVDSLIAKLEMSENEAFTEDELELIQICRQMIDLGKDNVFIVMTAFMQYTPYQVLTFPYATYFDILNKNNSLNIVSRNSHVMKFFVFTLWDGVAQYLLYLL